ncbi:MAG TPA: enoyl-CoA hydratase-related protein [Vicinamibacterales bacterium]|nr:enoyl-CoA hydratase-related protein [Vicinamibacterales bacterium]
MVARHAEPAVSHIALTHTGAVGLITIDRRSRFNSLDVQTAQDLRRAALQCARDERVRVVVLRGSGGVFCSGADLKYIAGGGAGDDLAYLRPAARPTPGGYGEVFKQILEYLHSTISEIRRSPKPFIAAVDGMAAAGGLGLAMCCDLVLASSRASFEWAYGKTGLTGAESSTFFLPRLIGLRRALELALLNPRLDAARALELGLVTAVIPVDRFDEEVLALAARLAKGPMDAYGVTKSLMNQAAGVDRLDYHLDQELEHLARSADTAAFAEGLDAFLSRREPRFASHSRAPSPEPEP